MAEHNALGKKGENIAIDFLIKKGYNILEKNYRYLKSEIDVITIKEDTIVVIEVKTRSSSSFGNPQDFLKPKQIESLVKAINHYIIEKDLDNEIRFDIIAILISKSGVHIEHLENAFYHF